MIGLMPNLWISSGVGGGGGGGRPHIPTSPPRDTTKIVNKPCQDCGDEVMMLCSSASQIVAVRCPRCTKRFIEENRSEYV